MEDIKTIKMNENLSYYSENKKDNSLKEANSNLSTLSKLISDILNIKDNNLVFTFPESKFNILPIIAYEYCNKYNKDYLIVSNEKLIIEHLKDYQFLANYNGGYVFLSTIPILVSQETSQIKIYNMRIPNRIRNSYSNDLFRISKYNETRKVIFTDYNNLDLALNNKKNTTIEGLSISSEINTNIGLIFFEKFEHILKNKILLNNFKLWVKELNKNGIYVLIHISNPYIERVEDFFDNNYQVININNYLIREFLSKTDEIIGENKFEIVNDFSHSFNVEAIGNIDLGNLNDIEINIKSLIHQLKAIKNLPKDFYISFNLLNNLRNLVIHPSFYKFIMLDENDNYLYGTFDRFIEILSNKFDEDDENFELLGYLISSIKTYYDILVNTNRYGEKYHHSTESKNSYLIKYLIKLNEMQISKINVGIVFYENIEKKILLKQFEKIKLNKISIYFLNYKTIHFTDIKYEEVIFPGIKGHIDNFINTINKFHNIKILTYSGIDSEYVKSKISINHNKYIQKSINSLKKLKIKENKTIKKFLKEIKFKEIVDTKEELFYPDILESIIKNNNNNLIQYKGYNNSIEQKYKIYINELDTDIEEVIFAGDFTIFNRINRDNTYEKILTSELVIGDYIFKIGDDENGIFKLIEETYDIDDIIDFDIMKNWKDWFYRNIELKKKELLKEQNKDNIKIVDLYLEYQKSCKLSKVQIKTYQTFLGWIKDKRIGPDNPKDLLILGKMTNYPDIELVYEDIFNEMQKIRKLHIVIGKQLNKIISIILNRKTSSILNFQEQFIYDTLKIYQIKHIHNKSN